jgi:serine protease Do
MESSILAASHSQNRLPKPTYMTFYPSGSARLLASIVLLIGTFSAGFVLTGFAVAATETGRWMALQEIYPEQIPSQEVSPSQEVIPSQEVVPPQEAAPPQEQAGESSGKESATASADPLLPVTEAASNAKSVSESAANFEPTSPEAIHFQEVVLGKVEPNLQDFRQLQQRVNSLVSQLRPSVVGIRMGGGQGSGVLVSGDGYVLTAAHVVGKKGQRAEIVMPDGSTHPAIVLGTDAASDSGMLRMVEKGPWPYSEIGESDSLLRGQWLLALGHPGGFDPDRSSVVRVGRLLMEPSRTTLQTDCTLVGGDSGGPLFDLDGRVVGIHSRISRRIQQNYHVSVDIFTSQWDEMSKEPTPTLGFRIKSAEVTEELVIDRLVGDGPADKAGLKTDDRILRFDGEEVKTRDDLRTKMSQLQLDQKVKIVVWRGDAEVELELQVELK